MTQQEKELLLADLSARLPYGVLVQTKASGGCTTEGILWSIEYNETGTIIFHKDSSLGYSINEDIIKPYLRPMSSMTKKEKKEFDDFCVIDEFVWKGNAEIGYKNQAIIMSDAIEWLLKKHFDYRGLIEKGLAIEAPDGMYNNKEE